MSEGAKLHNRMTLVCNFRSQFVWVGDIHAYKEVPFSRENRKVLSQIVELDKKEHVDSRIFKKINQILFI